jgi:hypothetical protein
LKSFRLDQYQGLINQGRLLEQDRRGVKVLQTAQGQMVKFFRPRNVLSSALFRPYAVRFVKNARKLHQLGIITVGVQDVCYCREEKCHLVFYDPVPGETLRDTLANTADVVNLLKAFADFLAGLHEKGVLFRSVHFGNVIVAPGQKFGLIDIADMKIKGYALSVAERVRNFRHMTRYAKDCQLIADFGADSFVHSYLEATGLSEKERRSFLLKLPRCASFFQKS